MEIGYRGIEKIIAFLARKLSWKGNSKESKQGFYGAVLSPAVKIRAKIQKLASPWWCGFLKKWGIFNSRTGIAATNHRKNKTADYFAVWKEVDRTGGWSINRRTSYWNTKCEQCVYGWTFHGNNQVIRGSSDYPLVWDCNLIHLDNEIYKKRLKGAILCKNK